MSDKKKYDVYQYQTDEGSVSLYSDGVKRDFGENKVVFIGSKQVVASVQPLYDPFGLELVGHLYTKE